MTDIFIQFHTDWDYKASVRPNSLHHPVKYLVAGYWCQPQGFATHNNSKIIASLFLELVIWRRGKAWSFLQTKGETPIFKGDEGGRYSVCPWITNRFRHLLLDRYSVSHNNSSHNLKKALKFSWEGRKEGRCVKRFYICIKHFDDTNTFAIPALITTMLTATHRKTKTKDLSLLNTGLDNGNAWESEKSGNEDPLGLHTCIAITLAEQWPHQDVAGEGGKLTLFQLLSLMFLCLRLPARVI